MKKPAVIGIDLGGTAIKLGRFLQDGTYLQKVSIPTPQPATPEAVLDAIAVAIKQLNSDQQAIAIGIGVPGAVDVTGRIAKVAINLSGWQDVPVADILEEKVGLPTAIANDANCAGLGEMWQGAGKKYQNLIVLTLGTGVGGAIILNGELFTGHTGSAGELGLITLNPDGPPCNSGNNGSFEQYCSIGAIIRQWGKEPSELGKLASAGDPFALEAWQSYGKLLGSAITSLIYILTPEAVIIGGGISASADFFFPATVKEIEKRVLPSSRVNLQLLKAKLGNDAGMIGAAKLAFQLS
jgi:glucokinase